MPQKKNTVKVLIFLIISFYLFLSSTTVSAAAALLLTGMEGDSVTTLQKNLKKLGYFDISPTGYYGEITASAVRGLQRKYGLDQDGIAGYATLKLINKLLDKDTRVSSVSRGAADRDSYLIPWYGAAEKIFDIGDTALVYDIGSGESFYIKRSYGYNHADCETLTAEDTKVMKDICGGEWSWARRPVIITVDGRKVAASIACMPHAGRDDMPADIMVKGRSEGYGTGYNLDKIKGNGMDGHFDVHFLGSRTHCSNEVEPQHQEAVKKAAAWAEKNY